MIEETKKYEFTGKERIVMVDGEQVTLHQIRAAKDFDGVHEGDLGGWIERESNLSQESASWVADDAIVMGNAVVNTNARVYGNAVVKDLAVINNSSEVYGNAVIQDFARIIGAEVYDHAIVQDFALVCSPETKVFGNAKIEGWAFIGSSDGEARVFDNANIGGHAKIIDSTVNGNSKIDLDASIETFCTISGNAKIYSELDLYWDYDDDTDTVITVYPDDINGISVCAHSCDCSLGAFCSDNGNKDDEGYWYNEIPIERRRAIVCKALAEFGVSEDDLAC